jgi:hypothetical protein
MADPFAIADIRGALASRAFPSLVVWNRLEGRPRTHDFDRALAVEVRDALWMLTRQWQLGEFHGDDAGSPVTVQMQVDRQPLARVKRGDGPVEPIDDSAPLETIVERRPVSLTRENVVRSLDLRLLMGRQWLRMVADIGPYDRDFIAAYPIELPDPARPDHAAICAHLDSWQTFAAVAGRRMDGWRLFEHLRTGRPYDGIVGIDPADHASLDARAAEFQAWVRALIVTAEDFRDDAWTPDRLEYRFECAAAAPDGERVFTADEYRGGALDWYALDEDQSRRVLTDDPGPTPSAPVVIRQATLPVQVAFQGMPSTRWWEFEDGRTNFGQVRPDTTDLAKLLLIEFGLVYANDWFVVPCTLPAGSVATVRGLVVTNVFGERLWIEPVDRGADASWSRFSIFMTTRQDARGGTGDPSLLLLPTVPAVQEGPVLEEVLLVRCRPCRRCRKDRCSRRFCWCATKSRTWCGESNVPCRLPQACRYPAPRQAARHWRGIGACSMRVSRRTLLTAESCRRARPCVTA